MSHFTKLDKAQITSPDAFIAALAEMGFKDARRNVTSKDYYGGVIQADVAVGVTTKNGQKYDVCLVRRADGKFDVQGDWWAFGGALNQDRMLQLTTKHTIVQTYKRRGFRATVTEDKNKNMTVKLTRA